MLNLIKNHNIKFYSKWLFIITVVSCDANYLKVSESEIQSASMWNANDQMPSFPECENIDKDEQLNCFKNIIEIEMNNFIDNKIFPLDTLEYMLTLKIDTVGNFSLEKIEPLDKLDQKFISIISEGVKKLPQALPAIKTNVGEFVEVIFKLPFRLNYE
ncbi:MAG: hypothetical protein EVA41_03370 [Flavobacteriales bacterium]|nr:MAG: hypothetical protein EVA41_03370 [Flavobacteriales bacterium]